MALAIGDVVGRPVLVVELLPNRHVAVERDRPRDVVTFDCILHVLLDLLEVELGRVDPDHDEAVTRVAIEPRPQLRERPRAVDARVRPEVVEHDLSSQVVLSERTGVDPRGGRHRRWGGFDVEVRRVDLARHLARIGVRADEDRSDGDRDENHGGNQVASISTPATSRSSRCGTCGGRHHVECKERALGPEGHLVLLHGVRRRGRTSVLALGVAIAATVGALVLPTTADAAEPASTTTVAPAAGVRMAALAPRVPEGATKLGAVAPTKDVTITVALRPTHEADLDALLDDLYDPASPNYGRWLGSGEFTSRFGPDPAQVAEVTGWLEGQGLHATPAQGMAVSATGDAQDVARALGVTFSNYRTADGDTGYIASDAPLVPRVVADGVAAIVGLNSTVQFESNADTTPHAKLHPSSLAADPRVAAAPRGAPAACSAARSIADGSFWTPDQVGRFYRVHDLFAAGLTGKGKTIALLELGRSRPADTAQFFKCFGLKNHVQVKRVNGGAGGGANA